MYKSDLNNKKNYNGFKNIYFGFNLPGIYKYIGQLYNNIKKSIIKNKCNNENILEKNLVEEIYANDKIKDIIFSKNKNEILFLYKDYILYYMLLGIKIKVKKKETKDLIYEFLNKIIQVNSISINIINDEANIYNLNCIDQILTKAKDDEKELIKAFSKIIFFLEYNSDFISKITFIFIDFIDIIPNFIENFIKALNNKRRCGGITNTTSENYILVKIFDSFLDIITDQFKFSYYFTNDNKKYIELLKKYFMCIKMIGKKIHSLSIQNFEIFFECITNKSNNLLNWILDIQKNSFNKNIIDNVSINKIKDNFNNLNDNDFTTLFNILIKLYQKKNNANDGFGIINFFLSNNKFKKDSFYLTFITSIFKLKEENFFNDNNQIILVDESIETKFNEIVKNNNNYLIENIIFYFEISNENKYFRKLQKESQEDAECKDIFSNESLKNIVYAYEFYEKNYKENKNLKLLYMIGYLKIYFKYYAKILHKHKNKSVEFGLGFKSIVTSLKLNQNTLESMKMLHTYILELILDQCHKNFDDLKSFIIDNNINYLKQYIENIEDIQDLNKFIKTNKNNNENYFKFCYEIPTIQLLKERIDQNRNPLLYHLYTNKDKITMLNKLPSINKIINIMMEFLNYKKTKDEINSKPLKDEKEISEIDNFNLLMEDYIKNYNSLVDDSKKIINKYENYSLDYFIIKEDSDKNSLYQICEKFIENQNQFIESLINDNIPEEINIFFKNAQTIHIQDANESNIPKLLDENEFFEIIMKNCFIEYSFDSNNNIIWDESYKKVNFNFEQIEKILIYETLSEIKKFYSAKYGIRTIKLKDNEYKFIDDQIINDYQEKFNNKPIDEEGKKSIIEFLKGIKEKENYELLLSLQYLLIHILSLQKKDKPNLTEHNDIDDIIKPIPKDSWIQFELLKQLLNINQEEGNGGENGQDEGSDIMDLFTNIINTKRTKQKMNYKLNQLISIFDICKSIYEKKKLIK